MGGARLSPTGQAKRRIRRSRIWWWLRTPARSRPERPPAASASASTTGSCGSKKPWALGPALPAPASSAPAWNSLSGKRVEDLPIHSRTLVLTMAIVRTLGGAPRWMITCVIVCLGALLLGAAILYIAAVHVPAAVARLARDGAVARPVHGIPYAGLINRAATAHRLNPALVAAVVAA